MKEVWARLKQLAPLGWLELPDIEPAELDGIFEEDLVLISRDLDGAGPFLEGCVRPAHILSAAQRLEKSVTEVWARLEQLAAASGLELPDIELAELENVGISEDDLSLAQTLDGRAPHWANAIMEEDVLRVSIEWLVPPDEILTRLRPFAAALRLGLPAEVRIWLEPVQ